MKEFDKDDEVGKLTVEQFTNLMVSVMETKTYLQAKREQEITQRIFKDAEGMIIAGVTPVRINTVRELESFCAEFRKYLVEGNTGSIVVAAAMLQGGEYKRT